MATTLQYVRRRHLGIASLAIGTGLIWFAYQGKDSQHLDDLRNSDFPSTYIAKIHLDLTSPYHRVDLRWVGPAAAAQDTGPFRSSPGAGWGTNDCNDPIESNCPDSLCTPKGSRKVEGLSDSLKDHPESHYVTFIDYRRRIGFHSAVTVPAVPASNGCVRLEPYAARLIHDNSIEGITEILIDGTWTNPRATTVEAQNKRTTVD